MDMREHAALEDSRSRPGVARKAIQIRMKFCNIYATSERYLTYRSEREYGKSRFVLSF